MSDDKIVFTANGELKAGGDIQWLYCTVTNKRTRGTDSSNAADILALINEINLYEDILSHTMYGNVTMVDTHNMINDFPFIGRETLYLGFVTPHVENRIEKVFKIYKVSDHFIQGNKQLYKLHFVSADAWADVRYTVKKKFQGTSGAVIRQVLQQLHTWDDFYSITGYTKPDLSNIDVNQGNEVKFVAPYWAPFECIKWLEKNSISQKGYADYLFFETNQGYKFKSLMNLFKQQPIEILKLDHSQSARDPYHEMIKVKSIRHVEVNDNITKFMNRAYGQTVFIGDIFRKNVTKATWNIQNSYNYNFDSISQNTFPLLDDNPNFNLDNYHNVATTHISNFFTNDMATEYEEKSNNTRLPIFNAIETDKLDISIWGRTYLKVGDVIGIIIGKFTQSKESEIAGDDLKNTSNWLISAIHHKLSPAQHEMHMQLIRNSTLETTE